ncbi:sensor histidine kinase, partial [Microbacterium arthrosphaerae]
APGGPVDVRLAWLPDRVELSVRNPLPTEPVAAARSGHGLIGMRERAQLAGGRLDVADEAGAFTVRATIPLGAPA